MGKKETEKGGKERKEGKEGAEKKKNSDIKD